jgi:hypothetical protein
VTFLAATLFAIVSLATLPAEGGMFFVALKAARSYVNTVSQFDDPTEHIVK